MFLVDESNLALKNNMVQFNPISHINYDNFSSNNNIIIKDFNPYSTNSSAISLAGNQSKNTTRNVFYENLLYNPKIIENDDEVKKNISEQIKSVCIQIIISIFF